MASDIEIWESNVHGRISMSTPGPRDTLRKHSAVGKGARLRIAAEDRELVEELIRDEQHNPFINGKLSQVAGTKRVPREDEVMTNQQLSDDELSDLFALDTADFATSLDGLSEVNIRRLKTLFREKGGTVAQLDILQEYTEAKWPSSSGETETWREMRAEATTGAGAR